MKSGKVLCFMFWLAIFFVGGGGGVEGGGGG